MVDKLTDAEFVRIYTHMQDAYGINLSKKKIIVEGRLENYVRSLGFHNYTDYLNAVFMDSTGRLEEKLVDYLTTNHTYFMRESEHFDYFRSVVLPSLKVKCSDSKDLRIWCGASSSGEEPYTIAMIIADFLGLDYEKWDTRILATDLSTDILRKAIQGIYTKEQIDLLPYMITDEIRQDVLFRQFNLMDPFPFRKKLHVVFLRNVMIYFEDDTKKQLLQKVYDCLEPGGYLFIGRTETIHREDSLFTMVSPSIFRK